VAFFSETSINTLTCHNIPEELLSTVTEGGPPIRQKSPHFAPLFRKTSSSACECVQSQGCDWFDYCIYMCIYIYGRNDPACLPFLFIEHNSDYEGAEIHFGSMNILCNIITHPAAILQPWERKVAPARNTSASCQSVPTQQPEERSGPAMTASPAATHLPKRQLQQEQGSGFLSLRLPTATRFRELRGMCGEFDNFGSWRRRGPEDWRQGTYVWNLAKIPCKIKKVSITLFIKRYLSECKE
jgi:hypothetical protein